MPSFGRVAISYFYSHSADQTRALRIEEENYPTFRCSSNMKCIQLKLQERRA